MMSSTPNKRPRDSSSSQAPTAEPRPSPQPKARSATEAAMAPVVQRVLDNGTEILKPELPADPAELLRYVDPLTSLEFTFNVCHPPLESLQQPAQLIAPPPYILLDDVAQPVFATLDPPRDLLEPKSKPSPPALAPNDSSVVQKLLQIPSSVLSVEWVCRAKEFDAAQWRQLLERHLTAQAVAALGTLLQRVATSALADCILRDLLPRVISLVPAAEVRSDSALSLPLSSLLRKCTSLSCWWHQLDSASFRTQIAQWHLAKNSPQLGRAVQMELAAMLLRKKPVGYPQQEPIVIT